jgi:hypothetical protein
VIDLVDHQPCAAGAAGGGEAAQVGLAQHRTGRVGRARDDEAVKRLVQGGHRGRGGLEPGRGVDRHRDDVDVEGLEDVAVGRVARLRHRDPVAGVEGGQERQDERARGPRRDRHALRRDLEPVPLPVVPRDSLTQHRQAQGLRVAEAAAVLERLGCGGQRLGWRSQPGLADLQVQYPFACRRTLVRRLEHLHDDEGRHPARTPRRHAPRNLDAVRPVHAS